ncbi:MAG TPA: hypothetical protein VI039_13125 [Solirubrobacterales bacterium]
MEAEQLLALRNSIAEEIAIYRRDEQECFKRCGPHGEPTTIAEAEAQTHGQVASNHADRLSQLLPADFPIPTKGQEGR